MKIVIGSDHAGFALKEYLKTVLTKEGYIIEDCGAETYNEDDDYPEFVAGVARQVSADSKETRGVVLGGSGQGEAIVANRFPNVRAVVFYGGTEDIIRLSREHNDANVLSLGARFLSEESAKEVVLLWLKTEFSKEERHIRRIEKIETYPNE